MIGYGVMAAYKGYKKAQKAIKDRAKNNPFSDRNASDPADLAEMDDSVLTRNSRGASSRNKKASGQAQGPPRQTSPERTENDSSRPASSCSNGSDPFLSREEKDRLKLRAGQLHTKQNTQCGASSNAGPRLPRNTSPPGRQSASGGSRSSLGGGRNPFADPQ